MAASPHVGDERCHPTLLPSHSQCTNAKCVYVAKTLWARTGLAIPASVFRTNQ